MKSSRIRLKVASPCQVSWDSMQGTGAVRHCGRCDKDVYELSAMSNEEIEALLTRQGERPCVRFYRRKDGTLLTEDCPVGASSMRRTAALGGLALAALGGLSALVTPADHPTSAPAPRRGGVETLEKLLGPATPTPPRPDVVMGSVAHVEHVPTPPPRGEILMGEVSVVEHVPAPVKKGHRGKAGAK